MKRVVFICLLIAAALCLTVFMCSCNGGSGDDVVTEAPVDPTEDPAAAEARVNDFMKLAEGTWVSSANHNFVRFFNNGIGPRFDSGAYTTSDEYRPALTIEDAVKNGDGSYTLSLEFNGARGTADVTLSGMRSVDGSEIIVKGNGIEGISEEGTTFGYYSALQYPFTKELLSNADIVSKFKFGGSRTSTDNYNIHLQVEEKEGAVVASTNYIDSGEAIADYGILFVLDEGSPAMMMFEYTVIMKTPSGAVMTLPAVTKQDGMSLNIALDGTDREYVRYDYDPANTTAEERVSKMGYTVSGTYIDRDAQFIHVYQSGSELRLLCGDGTGITANIDYLITDVVHIGNGHFKVSLDCGGTPDEIGDVELASFNRIVVYDAGYEFTYVKYEMLQHPFDHEFYTRGETEAILAGEHAATGSTDTNKYLVVTKEDDELIMYFRDHTQSGYLAKYKVLYFLIGGFSYKDAIYILEDEGGNVVKATGVYNSVMDVFTIDFGDGGEAYSLV